MQSCQTTFVAIATAITISSTFSGSAQDSHEPKTAAPHGCFIPHAEDISLMVAELYCHPFGFKDTDVFRIPPKHYEDVLNRFKDSEVDSAPPTNSDFSEIGTVRVTMRNGGCVRYCWYTATAKSRLHFSCAGQRYVHVGERHSDDEALSLDGWLRDTCRASIELKGSSGRQKE